jgi:hypothetical protein
MSVLQNIIFYSIYFFVICLLDSYFKPINRDLLNSSYYLSIYAVVSQEFKRINEDVQHILKYFHGKSGSILPYALQVHYSILNYSTDYRKYCNIHSHWFLHRPCFAPIVHISTSVELLLLLSSYASVDWISPVTLYSIGAHAQLEEQCVATSGPCDVHAASTEWAYRRRWSYGTNESYKTEEQPCTLSVSRWIGTEALQLESFHILYVPTYACVWMRMHVWTVCSSCAVCSMLFHTLQ